MQFAIKVTAFISLGVAFGSAVLSIRTGFEAYHQNRFYELKTPDFSEILNESDAEAITRGKDYLNATYKRLPDFVGAKMNCTSCHLNNGTTPNAGPWIGVTTQFPQYRDRTGKLDTLEDRINDCFERSLNGKRLPQGHQAMQDMIRYMKWLSKGYPPNAKIRLTGMPHLRLDRQPDLDKGSAIYQAKCASCHQQNGEGLFSEKGDTMFPALWGNKSFNIGAGMARLHTAAGFVKHNMPLELSNTLSDEEAFDVAAFFTQQPRPDFSNKHLDWPLGKKPKDARY